MIPPQNDDARSPVPASPRRSGPHEQTLRAWLDQLRQRWRLLTGLGVAARVVGLLAGVVLLAWMADRVLHPTGLALVALYVAAGLIGVAGTVLLLSPLRRVPTNRQLARLAEERDGSLDEVVVTATERLEAEQSGAFDGLVVRSAAERLQALEPERVIERSTMSRAWRWAVVAAAVFVASAGVGWGPAWRALQTARLYIAPPSMEVRVHPGHARIVRGSALRITAELQGLPSGATPEPPVLLVTPQGGGVVRVPMRGDGGRFVADWPSVDRAMRYRVESGSLTSPEFRVAALDAARVTRIDLEYAFPAFTKLSPRREEDAGDIFGPAGTIVRVRVHTDKPVTRGALALREGGPVALAPAGSETTLAADLTLRQDGAYRVALTDVDGLASPEGTEYFIRILDDRPPDVRIMRPGGDRQVTRLEEIVLEARADDDHGISALELVYAVKGAKEKVVPLHRAPRDVQRGTTSVNGAHTLYVEELDVVPGDFITYYARARDVGRGKQPTEARSDIFFLEVRPFTEEFFAAQSQAMMAGGGGQAADLLEAQKEIIVATWKLQRRAIAGQSAADVRAVGKAQGELRKQAEQQAAQMTRALAPRRRREAAPQLPAPVADENPLLKASAAMGRAEGALNALKPGTAIPHEMTAYNELLKLQAENTRREVSRQRGGGGGGGRSGTQDLSALFDEELLRQQETNYENRNAGNASSSQDQAKNDALEKLKALARRQDEIAQRQRELARARAALPREEVKRQLERLTREQEELRRQTEALAEQMARQQRDGQQQGSPSQGQQASGQSGQGQSGQSQGRGSQSQQASGADGGRELREAAEQMAGAARELSEDNLDEAQRQAEQTRDRLRELERRMEGEAVPDEGRRAFGELQLESQQVAEAQRRLANESQRLQAAGRPGASGASGRSGRDAASPERPAETSAGTRDALRRLAADQERLAQRTDALDKRLQGITRQRGGEEAAKAAVGAREAIARSRLAEEMRRSAQALRQAGAPGSAAEARPAGRGTPAPNGDASASTASVAEQADALARAAAAVADRLGAPVGDSPEARQLSDRLAQLRGLRERMGDIESRLRDAVQRSAGQAGRAGGQPGPSGTPSQAGRQSGSQEAGPQAGQQGSGGQPGGSPNGRQAGGQAGGQGGGRDGGTSEIQRLQAEYDAALRQTRQLMDGMSRQGNGQQTGAMATPEGHEFSRSAPGTEAFKQDYAKWESLTRNVNNALETMEASLAQRLSERAARDRVNAGGDERVPAQYSDSVSRYYRSLARKPPQ